MKFIFTNNQKRFNLCKFKNLKLKFSISALFVFIYSDFIVKLKKISDSI
jgi:hypothetical protein